MAGMDDWSEIEFGLFDSMVGHSAEIYGDQWMQTLYDTALFEHDISADDRAAVLSALRDYLWDNYGVDFDDVFDWEGYREAYDNAQV
jgi:hypothetical protein